MVFLCLDSWTTPELQNQNRCGWCFSQGKCLGLWKQPGPIKSGKDSWLEWEVLHAGRARSSGREGLSVLWEACVVPGV